MFIPSPGVRHPGGGADATWGAFTAVICLENDAGKPIVCWRINRELHRRLFYCRWYQRKQARSFLIP